VGRSRTAGLFALKLALVVAVLLPLGCGRATVAEAQAFEAAGVIPYFVDSGVAYVLCADHRDGGDRGWGAFGGYIEAGETPEEAAARELYEETRCLYPVDDVLPEIDGDRRIEAGSFVAFVVEVPFRPVFAIEGRDRENCEGAVFEERGPYAWIPLGEIVRAVEAAGADESAELDPAYLPPGAQTKLWRKSADLIVEAQERGLLPYE
jgi:8-oxo-dGTP pyrophosphatase MutT (NUDIX family)